jgi:hypothetical protein
MIGASAATVAVVSNRPMSVVVPISSVKAALSDPLTSAQSCCLGDCSMSCFALSSATRIDGVQGRE